MNERKIIDMIGKRCGNLQVIERVDNLNRQATWRCKCDCGNECIVRGYCLRKGIQVSCGCFKYLYNYVKMGFSKNDIEGKRFGMLLVIGKDFTKYRHLKKGSYHLYECICDCGNVKHVTQGNLVSGNTKSCGCRRHASKVNSPTGR